MVDETHDAAPESDAPESDAPESDAPDSDAPASEAPSKIARVADNAPESDRVGTYGPPIARAAGWWLIGSAILLLLPRQWASAGIALVLAMLLFAYQRRRDRAEAAATGR